jgi:hypothetical protein
MTAFYMLLVGLGAGGVGGYLLATHIHSVAAAAAKSATAAINKAVDVVNPPSA